jgi:hypothetical protein
MPEQTDIPHERTIPNGKRSLIKRPFKVWITYESAAIAPNIPEKLTVSNDPTVVIVDGIQLLPVTIHFTKKGIILRPEQEFGTAQIAGTCFYQ